MPCAFYKDRAIGEAIALITVNIFPCHDIHILNLLQNKNYSLFFQAKETSSWDQSLNEQIFKLIQTSRSLTRPSRGNTGFYSSPNFGVIFSDSLSFCISLIPLEGVTGEVMGR